MSPSGRLFAHYYPRVAARAEEAGVRELRRELISQAAGRTLELGAGSGLNLPHYTERVSELALTDPSAPMLSHLRAVLAARAPAVASVSIGQRSAEALPYADASLDTVVATFVLCTVRDPVRALDEVARVLVPGGRFLFLEHVRAPEGTALGRVQDALVLPHRLLGGGCHPNRRTEQLLAGSRLQIEQLEHGQQPSALPTVRPTIRGVAIRRS